jgi:hypothetical protein
MNNVVSRYRTALEWSLSAAALTTVIVVMLWVDSPVRQYVLGTAANLGHDVIRLRVPGPLEHAARSVWQVCMDHQQLAGFAGVAAVLVFFMRRMR